MACALLANFNDNPPYGMPTIQALVPELIPHVLMTDDPPSFEELKRACAGKRKMVGGLDGVLHRLLGMLLDNTLHTLYKGLLQVCATKEIVRHWLQSKAVVVYKKGDLNRTESYHPIAMTNSICLVLIGQYGPRLQRLVGHITSLQQYGSEPMHTATEQAPSLVNSPHAHEMAGRGPFVILLDVGKAFCPQFTMSSSPS